MKKLAIAALLGLSLGLSGCVISVDSDGEYGHHSDWQEKERERSTAADQASPKQVIFRSPATPREYRRKL